MTNGFVFAVTGPDYTSLVRQAAATVAEHHPNIPIDLFTDQDCTDPVFSQITPLNAPATRPRFEALLRSRFDKTICLDADLFVIAPIADIFDVLGHFDLAAAHDQRLNVASHTLRQHSKPIPAAFPQYNSGVLGIRKSDRADRFIYRWKEEFENSPSIIDQPILRELLFDSDLRIATLPPQYNVIDADLIRSLDSRTMAPRIIHSSRLHLMRLNSGQEFQTLAELVGPDFEQHLQEWLLRDKTLNSNRPATRTEPFCDKFPGIPVHADAKAFAGKASWKQTLLTWLGRIASFGRQ
ncbi:Nucleotide-diphospho-sugar transferase [Shimia gijangensis]|uniref:Nucleotide-diphospho-sugar transferase n=1 Tax=Shimia gijangensis TaxID=1470563 RepID=A0A1M6FJK2_9RHOB|nr:putative nucleotide-diphospho-sugar transferase [Shimia gijangensis]SHI97918.1 Nucleotide-diphospho-sugar transferase [Shimia gijangensis]